MSPPAAGLRRRAFAVFRVSLRPPLREVEFGASISSPARARPRRRTRGAKQGHILQRVSYTYLLPGLLITQYTKTPSSRSTGYLLYCSSALGTHTRPAESSCLRSILSHTTAAARGSGWPQGVSRPAEPRLPMQRRPAREMPAQDQPQVPRRTTYESSLARDDSM